MIKGLILKVNLKRGNWLGNMIGMALQYGTNEPVVYERTLGQKKSKVAHLQTRPDQSGHC